MASRKKPSGPAWQIILEDIQSQNRSTAEAVEASRAALEQRIDRLAEETRSRDSMLELGVRQNAVDIRDLKLAVSELKVAVGENSADIRGLNAAVGGLKAAVGETNAEVRTLKAAVVENGVDIRTLTARVEALAGLEERVAALERRAGS